MPHILDVPSSQLPELPQGKLNLLYKAIFNECCDDLSYIVQILGQRSIEQLKGYSFQKLQCEQVMGDAGRTQKKLLKTLDGQPLESVWLPEGHKNSICVSSQSGCAYGCRFCATGKMKLNRSLSCWEIVDQVLSWKRDFPNASISNIVFMGMGEPMANLDEVLKASDILADTQGLGISYRRITISTVGVLSGIKKMTRQHRNINLILSLHGTTDEQRRHWMPRTASLNDLRQALLEYQKKTNRRIGIAYLLKPGFNDHQDDIVRLKSFLDGMTFKMNLLCYNPIDERDTAVTVEQVESFKERIQGFRQGVVTVRYPAGRENWAACGQLGANFKQNA